MAGFCDQSTKEKALTQAMMDTIIDLNSLVRWCIAEESGRQGTPVNPLAPVRQSLYKLDKKIKLCCNCGLQRHGDGSPLAREKEFKAHNKICQKCGKKNHFAKVCKSAPTGRNGSITDENSDLSMATQGALHLFYSILFIYNLQHNKCHLAIHVSCQPACQ